MKNVFPVLLGCVGVAVIVHGKPQVADEIAAHEMNPLELKGSPYGEIIGMALQEPVHLLWHGGKGHEHVSAEGEDCEVCGTDHSEDGVSNYLADKSASTRLKLKMLSMENGIRQNNNPTGRSADVIAFEHQRAQELIEYAYEMDPTNFGNYNVVSFLYGTSDSAEKRAKVSELAERTLAACEGRVNDPSDRLTAASAAHNILISKSMGMEHAEYYKLAEDYDFFAKKVREFDVVFQKALDEGRLKNYTQEKVDEIINHYKEFAYALREYRIKIEAAQAQLASPGEGEEGFRFDLQPSR